VITQLDMVQNAEGHFVEGLFWDVGTKAIIADILAPIWVLSIVIAGMINRRLLARYDADPDFVPTSRLGKRFLTDTSVRHSTWVATVLAGTIVVMSWTREWERFGQQPPAFWFVSIIVGTIILTLLPIWWIRLDLFTRIHESVSSSSTAARVDAFLFTDHGGTRRWAQLLVFSALTGIVAIVVLGQLDSLLKGMHPTGEAQVGINDLASVFQLDLSVKPAEISQRVSLWVEYAGLVGPSFATAYSVTMLYLTVDAIFLTPAYVLVIGVLLLHARRTQPESLSARSQGSYQFLIGVAVAVLGVIAIADLIENLMTARIVDSIWQNDGYVSSWSVRVMWFASLFRTIGSGALIASGLLVLAFRRERVRSVFQTLVAVRGEILVLLFMFFGLSIAQTADVIRRWDISIAILSVFFGTALAMVLFWTSGRVLTTLRRNAAKADKGEVIEPALVTLPWASKPISLRKAVVRSIVGIALLQVLLAGLTDIPAGLGFTVPVVLFAVLWLFGIPLPTAAFIRGERRIPERHRRSVPRLLGSLVFVMLGVAVIRAAVPQLVLAKHADWWLVFIALPIVMGMLRLFSKKGPHVGALEMIAVTGVGLVGLWLVVMQGNPELSPVALMFSGFMILYGSMPFFYSYEPDSGPSRLVETKLSVVRVQPLLALLVLSTIAVSTLLVLFPLDLADRIGTVAIIILGATMFAAFAAAAVQFAERTRPPRILAAFKLHRMPVFIFLTVWLAFAGIAATGASNDVEVITAEPGTSQATRGASVEDIWGRWLAANAAAHDDGQAIPMVFVASSGGGIRAAVWTAYVMDCAFGSASGAGFACEGAVSSTGTESIIATSGVSGGSLGLASYFGSHRQPSTSDDWVKHRLGDDYLAAPMAWLLFVDTPRSLIGFGPKIRDRADIMEAAWEKSWDDGGANPFLARGMFDTWESEPGIPPMIFNGTNIPDPCRFNASVLRTTAHDPDDTCTSLGAFEGRTDGVRQTATLAATKDLADYLCADQDIRISTAILLSARFPIVTPSGRIGEDLRACDEGPRDAFVVDGGYLEASAAGTISELWESIESRVAEFNASAHGGRCIVPFLIQIDNGYEATASTSPGARPKDVFVPVTALLGSQFGRMASAREAAAIRFDLPFHSAGRQIRVLDADGQLIQSRYARLTTRAHPGVQAPLGWTLSSASFDDLRSQLLTDENQKELAEVSRWLSGELTCADS
jgi:hypothetical protein